MRADDWIVAFLIEKGVTDVFGIPGVVVMDFLYAVDRRKPDITPHLNYHEQGSSFAACGYAQATGKLGVAYSTRGPGFTNMLTAMADAYYDSIPVMFITAHSTKDLATDMRVMNNQEIDTVALAKSITKRAVRIDSIDDLQSEVVRAYYEATKGRKGPVFLDIWNALFAQEAVVGNDVVVDRIHSFVDTSIKGEGFIQRLKEELKKSRRPVLLVGNGARSDEGRAKLRAIAERLSIPILSSRGGQDIVPESPFYFGFVGSRATRYSNFILSKTDLIISIGNRLSFPTRSKSFLPVVENATIIRVDIDVREFNRTLPDSIDYEMDALYALSQIENAELCYEGADEWLGICRFLKAQLDKYDSNYVVENIMRIIGEGRVDSPLVCDVGNHSFWVTTAYAYQRASNRIMYSGSFGTLGSAFPKAIGAYYGTKRPVICFTGDQGIQFNIQELEYISNHRVPVTIVILNNMSSGMIMEREIAKYGDYLVHTTTDSGYGFPNFEKLAACYGIDYTKLVEGDELRLEPDEQPHIIEIIIEQSMDLQPSLPIGNACQDLRPELPREMFDMLNKL